MTTKSLLKKLDDLVTMNQEADSYPVPIYVFLGERRLDTRMHLGARGNMGRIEGKIAIFLRLFP